MVFVLSVVCWFNVEHFVYSIQNSRHILDLLTCPGFAWLIFVINLRDWFLNF